MGKLFRVFFLRFVLAFSLVVPLGAGTVLAQDFPRFTIVFPLMAPRISSKFGPRKHPVRKVVRHHKGIDLAAPKNAHVRSIADGTVVFAHTYSGYGKLVTVSHGGGYTSHYGHLSSIDVEVGQRVRAGDLVGRVGSTGVATGPHLHFEWRKDGKEINPLKVFPELASDAEG